MNRKLLVLPVCIALTSCASTGGPDTAVVDDAGYVHHTKHYSQDFRGSEFFPEKRSATGKKVFVFDPRAAAWAAYDKEGHRVKTGSASGGKDFCEDVGRSCRTVTGTYRIYSKKGENCTSSLYPIETNGGARMPYCMHFHGGYSIHGAYEVPNYNASHGCIRVLPSAAKWLNENFIDIGTTVIVKPYS